MQRLRTPRVVRPLAPLALAASVLLALAVPAAAQELRPGAPEPLADEFERRITPEVLVVRAARPAVVFIETDVEVQSRDILNRWFTRRGRSSGSGVVIYEDGLVVTNFHVVDGAKQITVSFDELVDPTKYPATIVSAVPEEDLALLKIEGEGPFPTIPLGTSSDLMIGERTLAIGSPYGQTLTVSTGIISGLHRELNVVAPSPSGQQRALKFSNLIQTDASINPGNSGGPLLNINGRLIGINTAMNTVAENIGFAIPVDRVREVLEDSLLSPLARTWFGFSLDGVGLEIGEVLPGGPAAQAGLRAGDRLVAIGPRELTGPEEYTLARIELEPRRPVRFVVERDGRERAFELEGWERSEGYLYERAGLQVEPYSEGDIRRVYRLLRVTDVRPGGPAAELGLRVGDLIDSVLPRGRAYAVTPRTPEDLALVLSSVQRGSDLKIDVWRDENDNGVNFEYGRGYSELLHGTLRVD